MGKECENWSRFEVLQEQTYTSNHHPVACLRKGSENLMPLAQALFHKAKQRNLISFITSLENNWIQVVLSCNEHVSVLKNTIFFSQHPELRVFSASYWHHFSSPSHPVPVLKVQHILDSCCPTSTHSCWVFVAHSVELSQVFFRPFNCEANVCIGVNPILYDYHSFSIYFLCTTY